MAQTPDITAEPWAQPGFGVKQAATDERFTAWAEFGSDRREVRDLTGPQILRQMVAWRAEGCTRNGYDTYTGRNA